ncbi:MAG: phosphodiester glycosidase family protein [Spirochaetaceae bacterium]|jgi:epoxyqueuosine reductase|nr:phosphodiester glycosidase family protein [Spirochaetaceae bacterium]
MNDLITKEKLLDMAKSASFVRARIAAGRDAEMPFSLLVTALAIDQQEPRPVSKGYAEIAAFARDNYYGEAVVRLKEIASAIRKTTKCEKDKLRIFCNSRIDEKKLAASCGLGFSGRNSLIITPEAGSRVVIAALALPFSLESDPPLSESCGPCARCAGVCVESCPSGALTQKGGIKREKCVQWYASGNGAEVPPEVKAVWGRRLYGCEECQRNCPANKAVCGQSLEKKLDDSFRLPRQIECAPLVNQSDDEIKARFKRTALGFSWLGPAAIRRSAALAALLALALLFVACATTGFPADSLSQNIEKLTLSWHELEDGVELAAIRIKNPALCAWALRVQLAGAGASRIVMNEPESGGMPSVTVRSFAAENNCVAALNLGPFHPFSRKEGEPVSLVGVFIKNGEMLSKPQERYGALVFFNGSGGALWRQNMFFNGGLERIRYAAGGFSPVLESGVSIVPPERKARHPRSAAGFSSDGRVLYLLAINGRTLFNAGATEAETAALLRALGAESGLNLDGGGSSALVVKHGDKFIRLNKNGTIKDRAVASCIGVKASSELSPP